MIPHNSEPEPLLKLEDVSVTTPNTGLTLLDNISFTLYNGDRCGIVGASGAGKTTLLRLLNRLISPSKGYIFFQNQDIRKISPTWLRQQIVLVPQEPKLLGMTVKNALSYPLTIQKLAAPEIKSRLSSWIEKFNIPSDWFELNEFQLSLGQRQWVAIARGLLMEPRILLLDEPTSALDMGKTDYLFQIFREIAAEKKTTIVMINHQLNLVQNFAQKVLYLDKGKLKAEKLSPDIDWQKIKNDLVINQKNQNFDNF
jgi:D-methionine transport system ATP-binding protein